jgi:hypothetical protein
MVPLRIMMDLLVLFERGVIVGDMESIHMVRR